MRNFMLDSNIIGEKTEKGYSTTNSIIESLKKLEEICEAAYEEINSHDELENVDYISVTKDVQYLDEYKMKYQKFGGTLSGYTGQGGTKLIPNSYGGYSNTNTYSGYMGYNTYGGDTQTEGIMSEYKSEADYKFYSAKESLLERLSNTNLEDIRVDNNLGVTLKSPSSIFTPGIQTETSLAKDKIGIEDLLSFGVISKDLKKQYDENKELIEKYNESLDDYNPDNYPDAIPEFLTKAWYNLTKEKEESIDDFDDYAKAIITQGDFNFETTNEKALSLGLDFVPIVGEGKLGLEALFGEDLVTGKKLNGLERILSIIPAGATGVSKIIEKATVKDVDVAAEATIEKGTSVTFGMNGGGQLDDLLNRINKGEKVETEIAEVSERVSEARLKYLETLENGLVDDDAWKNLYKYVEKNGIDLGTKSTEWKLQKVEELKTEILVDEDVMSVIQEKANNLLELSDSRLSDAMASSYSAEDYYKVLNQEKSDTRANEYMESLNNSNLGAEWYHNFYGNDSKYVVSYMSKNDYTKFVLEGKSIGRPGVNGGQFVLPESTADSIEANLADSRSISSSTTEFKAQLAKTLGLPENAYNSGVVRVQIPIDADINLRIVSGVEEGCNYQWVPGTKTLGGTREGLISQILQSKDEDLYEQIINNSKVGS